MKEAKEIYYLPVEQLSDDAIQCIEKVVELLDAIKDDCNINNLSLIHISEPTRRS